MKSGFILINKPKDWTSHDVVGYIRSAIRRTLPRDEGKKLKVGHAGTLDPFATGLLIVGIGREATKRLDEFKSMKKTYIATIKLGEISDTYDPTGKITKVSGKKPSEDEVRVVLKSFIGKQRQLPPMYSAKKVGGKKLYDLARKGVEIERKPHDIEIYNINLIEYKYPFIEIEVDCSVGTYIRTLCHNIGQNLGTGTYCDKLKRIKIGKYDLTNAVEPKMINYENIVKNPIRD